MRTNKNENNIRFLFLCRCFIREREKHRQFLIFFNKNIKAILFSVKISKIDAYPCVVLPDQHMRDLTDVYRREKDFLEQRKNLISSDEMMVKTKEEEETALKFYVKEQYCNISCNCETSSAGRISTIKMSVEFFLFMGYAIGRRNELLECHYPFVPRTIYSKQTKNLNVLRDPLDQKPSMIKHTTTDTYYDIH
jgi:hypothetical protein